MEHLAWPIAVLLMVIFSLILFYKPISRLIDRTEKVSKKGIQTKIVQEQITDRPSSKVDEFLKSYDNQLLIEIEKILNSSLVALNPRDANEKEKFLLRNLAQVSITLIFEKTYYSIYGSQILTLKYLNENRNPQNLENIRFFYNEAVNKYPAYYRNYSFDNWFNYLVALVLVIKNGNEVSITLRAKEFLKYLIDQGYSSDKIG